MKRPHVFRFEHRGDPIVPFGVFFLRILRSLAVASIVVSVALGAGILGYHITEGLPWLDSFLNASMILGGMGPVSELHTTAGKVFAGCYALFAGLIFIMVAGIIFAPIFHRFLHRFHLDGKK
jgi:hypothetical protein